MESKLSYHLNIYPICLIYIKYNETYNNLCLYELIIIY